MTTNKKGVRLVYSTLLGLILFFGCISEEGPAPIVEENDLCICPEMYQPVCGSDGKTYSNTCKAGCNQITNFTTGPCDQPVDVLENQPETREENQDGPSDLPDDDRPPRAN